MMFTQAGKGTAITQVTEASAHVSISVPAGKGGHLIGVELCLFMVRETVVNGGGLVKLRNSSTDWVPFHLVTACDTVVTEGGYANYAPVKYPVNKYLPGNSTVDVDYTPYDNQSQYLEVTLVWILGVLPKVETFSGSIHPLKTAAVTATARASPGTYAVPGGKGGRMIAIIDMVWPTLETVLCSGGLRELENTAYDLKPCEKYTSSGTVTGASGGGPMRPDITIFDAPAPANSTYTSFFTPRDNQSQTLTTIVMWQRGFPGV